ncbi:hypothetical protein C8F04DRAFT_1191209 [Mycena alexandri]|uniref:Uncharacterized protein n=1 Tax=Mycena alexandri TaxID=1745969 RepID=A0AAD6SGG2_9AGAR|nr:hypothetical protein C8F04DRAFT_1191209 [Mycena alexandri]
MCHMCDNIKPPASLKGPSSSCVAIKLPKSWERARLSIEVPELILKGAPHCSRTTYITAQIFLTGEGLLRRVINDAKLEPPAPANQTRTKLPLGSRAVPVTTYNSPDVDPKDKRQNAKRKAHKLPRSRRRRPVREDAEVTAFYRQMLRVRVNPRSKELGGERSPAASTFEAPDILAGELSTPDLELELGLILTEKILSFSCLFTALLEHPSIQPVNSATVLKYAMESPAATDSLNFHVPRWTEIQLGELANPWFVNLLVGVESSDEVLIEFSSLTELQHRLPIWNL